MRETIPGRFETHLSEDPYAPALVAYRENGRARRWTRAAVEHRALRVATLCVARGLAADARICIGPAEPIDTMAAVYFTLATGRVLTTEEHADVLIDGQLLAAPFGIDPDYALRVVVSPDDLASVSPERFVHGELATRVELGRSTGLGRDIDAVLTALWRGTPLRVGDALRAESAA